MLSVRGVSVIAIAPDFLSGMGPNGGGTTSFTERSAVGQAIRDLPPDQITADLDAAVAYKETAGVEWKSGCSRVLSGRRSNVPVRHKQSQHQCGLRLLWTDTINAGRARQKRAGEDPSNTVEANKKARDEAWERWKKLL
ncbi:MAG TPA: hypothetical protein VJ023_18430 [Pyrinomonadaceae bacterium]|nr:hypothetical protein [Pyrinomonadaceae bacterium]